MGWLSVARRGRHGARGTRLTPAQVSTVLAALDELVAAGYARVSAWSSTCSSCQKSPGGWCVSHKIDLTQIDQFRDVAVAIRDQLAEGGS